jgi:hypothetical protein
VLTAAERPRWREEYGGRWSLELGVMALLLTAASVVAPLGDPDLPMHLALGEWIVRHGRVPSVEPFAWTRAGEPFYAYSWLPEVVFYSAYAAAGTLGLRVLQGAAVLATLGSVFVLARLARWSVWTAVVLASVEALLILVLAPYLRPHIVLLIVVPLAWGCAMRLLESTQPWRWAVVLLLLSALAANSHLLFPLVAAPWLLLAIAWPGLPRASWLAGATVAGWMIAPYSLDWPAVFALNFNDNVLFAYPTPISELTPGVQAAVSGRGALLAVAVALGILPWATRGLGGRERIVWGAAWLAGMFAFALAARALVMWWLLLIPLVALVIEPLARAPRRRNIVIAQRVALLALVLLLAAARARALQSPSFADTRAPRSLPSRPASLADPLASWLACRTDAGKGGRAFTAFRYGTYLTWLYPGLSYSIDGRNIFPDSVAAAEGYRLASRDSVELGPWRTADLAIVPFRYPVAAALDTATGWRRAAVVTQEPQAGDSVGIWVTERWWRAVSDSALPDPAARLPSGASGVVAACDTR